MLLQCLTAESADDGISSDGKGNDVYLLGRTMLIPAICKNELCKTVWLTPDAVHGDFEVTMLGCSVRPCPKCGGSGNVPAGTYSPVGGHIFNPSEWSLISRSLLGLRESILAGASVQEVQKAIESDHTLSKHLAGFIPKDLKDVQTLLIIIGMIYAACTLLMASANTSAKIMLPKPVIEIIKSIDVDSKTQSTKLSESTNNVPPKTDLVPESQKKSASNP